MIGRTRGSLFAGWLSCASGTGHLRRNPKPPHGGFLHEAPLFDAVLDATFDPSIEAFFLRPEVTSIQLYRKLIS
jgi:hypothetical protein